MMSSALWNQYDSCSSNCIQKQPQEKGAEIPISKIQLSHLSLSYPWKNIKAKKEFQNLPISAPKPIPFNFGKY